MNDAKIIWQRRFCFPTVVRALDCTQIEILKLTAFGDEYIYRKYFHSISVQASVLSGQAVSTIQDNLEEELHKKYDFKI